VVAATVLGIVLAVCVFASDSASDGREDQAVLATVGDRKITVYNFENHFYAMRPGSQRYYATQKNRRLLLNYAVGDKLRALLAEKLGYLREPRIMALLKDADLHSAPQDRSWVRDMILARIYLSRMYASELVVTDAEVKRYYNFHKNKYDQSVMVEASRIILPTESDAGNAEKRLEKGEPFDHVAAAMSRDRFAGAGGRLEPILILGRKPTQLERVLLFMHDGQISPVLNEDAEFAIYKKIRARPATQEAAKPFIEEELHLFKLNNWIKRGSEEFKVEIDEKLLSSLELRPPR